MTEAEVRLFRQACDGLRETVNREVKALARRVPEDGTSPGVNYRRDRARDCLHQVSHKIDSLLWQLGYAVELTSEAKPAEAADGE